MKSAPWDLVSSRLGAGCTADDWMVGNPETIHLSEKWTRTFAQGLRRDQGQLCARGGTAGAPFAALNGMFQFLLRTGIKPGYHDPND
jgi:hypothetical protein